ncbi:probable G-protein coupled receptor Mth-like 1 [Trichonephila inaurata madagascariensis]|uniref:Probable G-protein coupled receptor Mth-like 1 n=1 Tax=Trichonephila inaurata madagascariensis TaxID=2747483 RepID=A0A8X6MF82_9ARAC|nr:probable G-protein coupled receptor Mth-like 1 [Trichonephila inaurata madagascariensis]
MENFTATSLYIFEENQTDIIGTEHVNFNSSLQKPVLSKYYPFLAAELGLSILCSIILILVYIIIGEHRTIPGKNVITISLCLIVTYILLIIDLLMRNRIPHAICFTMGVTVQTTFLATFFWTNVMSYDIMRTMASVKLDSVRTSKFWKYSAYAWLMTFLCVVPAVVIDLSDFVPAEYKPKFGLKKCWLTGQLAYLVYFNLPVGLTLAANCIFFVLTARTIVRVRNATTILAANRHTKRFRLCMKLVLIMGLVWIAEFIPWLTGIYYLYAVAGLLNCLHGVYLFLIFACKRRILKQVIGDITCLCSRNSPLPAKKKQSPSLDTIITTISAPSFMN